MLGDPICRLRHSPSYLMLVCYSYRYIQSHSLSLFHCHRKYDYLYGFNSTDC
jgi:hypothetical protein